MAPPFLTISTAIAARFAPGQVTPPAGGYDNIRVSTTRLPGQMTPLPTVLVFPDEGEFPEMSAGKRDTKNDWIVRFYYNQTGDLERDTDALQLWLTVLVDQLRASYQLGGLTWSTGTAAGEVTKVLVSSYTLGTFNYAGLLYSGIELHVSVLLNETLVFVA